LREGKITMKRESGKANTTVLKPANKKKSNSVHKSCINRTIPDPKPERGLWIRKADKKDLIAVLDNLPYGVAILGSTFGNALYINKQILATLGYRLDDTPSTTSMVKKAIPDSKIRNEAKKLWKQMVADGGGTVVSPVLCQDGKVRTFEESAVVLRKNLIVNMYVDVTRREEAEEQLRKSEARFRSFFEQSTDPVCIFDGNHIVNCNRAAVQFFRLENKDQMTGTTIESLSPKKQPNGQLSSKMTRTLLNIAHKQGSCRTEWIVMTSDGVKIPVEMSFGTIELEARNLIFAVFRDITTWKEAQNTLVHAKTDLENRVRERTSDLTAMNRQLLTEIETRKKSEQDAKKSREELRHLSEHLQQIAERDRAHIAREVHDQLGQSLSALTIDLSRVREKLPKNSSGLKNEVLKIEKQIVDTMESVRAICRELRPPIFDDFGLLVAIKWYLREFQKRTGMDCGVLIDEEIPAHEKGLDLVILRIFQEAMTNILRHAGATKVRVTLKCRSGSLVLKVKDNGRGISPEQVMDPCSLGILGIRERVRFWGGKSSFIGLFNKGTTMTVSIPIARTKASLRSPTDDASNNGAL
jgi:PAS domain S-box-containing protein